MRSTHALPLLMSGVLLTACERQPAPTSKRQAEIPAPTVAPAQSRALPDQLPSLYAGVLPCADCEGIRHELDLRADSVFFLRLTYLGKPAPNVFDQAGQWMISDENVLVLHGRDDAPLMFSVPDAHALRKRDPQGREIESSLNYTLNREATYAPIEPQLVMRGLYDSTPERATFEECLTGLKLSVASDGDASALASAYAKLRKDPGQALLAQLEGRIVRRAGVDGSPRDMLVVDRMERFFPNESCGARGVTHELESTRWVLVRLGDESVEIPSGQREPYIALEPTEHRISGHGGCNRLVGGYELDGTALKFTQLALTRMACPDEKYESAFARALDDTVTWKITGNHLELFDAAGAPVARFEERNL